jgi:hypothetical protein
MLFLETFCSGEALRPSSSSNPPAGEKCCKALLEADAFRAIQPQPNSVALSKSSAQDIVRSFGSKAHRDGTRAFQAKAFRSEPTAAFPIIRRRVFVRAAQKQIRSADLGGVNHKPSHFSHFLKRGSVPIAASLCRQVSISFPESRLFWNLFGQAPAETASIKNHRTGRCYSAE